MQVYKQYAELLVTVVVPWMLLCILNIRIYWAVRTNRSVTFIPFGEILETLG